MTNTPFATIDDYRDIETRRHYESAVAAGADPAAVLEAIRRASRDNARTPMQWDDSPHAGFTDGEPWIGVNPNHVDVNAEAAMADPDSVLHHYRQLIALRRSHEVISRGDFTMLLADDPVVFAFTRRLDADEVLVVGNCSGDPVTAPIDGHDLWRDAEVLVSNCDGVNVTADGFALRPWEAMALHRTVTSRSDGP